MSGGPRTVAQAARPNGSAASPPSCCNDCGTLDDQGRTLSFVGFGRGDYRQETTYRYVGDGVGEFDVVNSTTTVPPWCLCLGCIGCLVPLIGLVIYSIVHLTAATPMDTSGMNADPSSNSDGYDCRTGYINRKRGWSAAKKHWCCQKEGLGCSSAFPRYDCQAIKAGLEDEEGWVADRDQRAWCCERQHVGCAEPSRTSRRSNTPLPYNCSAGVDLWQSGWSNGKKAWCCKHGGPGCTTTPLLLKPTTTAPFDCTAGRAVWEAGWSASKKAWCCHHGGPGCAAARSSAARAPCDADCSYQGKSGTCKVRLQQATAQDLAGHRDLTGQKEACSRAFAEVLQICPDCRTCTLAESGCVSTTSIPYDCLAGYANWETSWGAGKKRWCCHHRSRGCPTSTAAPYDCIAGYANWEHGWSSGKKAWCCKHGGRGCAGATTTPAYIAFDCNAGYSRWKQGWSSAKKLWCCDHGGRGCPPAATTPPYDCLAGYATWEERWTTGKKAWCCEHHGRGCPSSRR
eukprot:CAMPEP_0179145710 /NCGR_PEP_ID=MMETSP0796-20121207/70320_1 /TAXON_ID=73915 /ORGANISM="Pyrodinium bahamense, Strain pbaha01" /LENGTH=512 /DNA_ID=CAMNT_0020846129 /DNA_START=27 /DNA_END=1565 /DNA_ORIENTATION=+